MHICVSLCCHTIEFMLGLQEICALSCQHPIIDWELVSYFRWKRRLDSHLANRFQGSYKDRQDVPLSYKQSLCLHSLRGPRSPQAPHGQNVSRFCFRKTAFFSTTANNFTDIPLPAASERASCNHLLTTWYLYIRYLLVQAISQAKREASDLIVNTKHVHSTVVCYLTAKRLPNTVSEATIRPRANTNLQQDTKYVCVSPEPALPIRTS